MKPKVAFLEFTSCEGCQLEVLNLTGEELLDLLGAVDGWKIAAGIRQTC